MKKNERQILKCSCGRIISSVSATKGTRPGIIVQSHSCYACQEKIKDRRKQSEYLYGGQL